MTQKLNAGKRRISVRPWWFFFFFLVVGHFKSLSPVFLPSQGLFSKLLPFPQSEKLLVFWGFFLLVFVACSKKSEDLFWDLWIITILVVLHLHVVVICHCELLLPRRQIQLDRRKTVSYLMTCFSAPWDIYKEWGPQHRWLKPIILLCLLSGKHGHFRSSLGHGSDRTFCFYNHQGAIATPVGHWTSSFCHSLKDGLLEVWYYSYWDGYE